MLISSIRKANEYNTPIKDPSSTCNKVSFIYLSMGALGIMCSTYDSFISLLQNLNYDKLIQKNIIMKTFNITTIRSM